MPHSLPTREFARSTLHSYPLDTCFLFSIYFPCISPLVSLSLSLTHTHRLFHAPHFRSHCGLMSAYRVRRGSERLSSLAHACLLLLPWCLSLSLSLCLLCRRPTTSRRLDLALLSERIISGCKCIAFPLHFAPKSLYTRREPRRPPSSLPLFPSVAPSPSFSHSQTV